MNAARADLRRKGREPRESQEIPRRIKKKIINYRKNQIPGDAGKHEEAAPASEQKIFKKARSFEIET